MDDILAAHRALYDAVETGDADLMHALWFDDPDTTCVHPGAPMLRGTAEVVRSWVVLMAHIGYIQFFLTDVEVNLMPAANGGPTTAVVTCTENILSGDPSDPEGLSQQGSFGAGTVISTSILINDPAGTGDGAGWKFWARHASPIDPATQEAR